MANPSASKATDPFKSFDFGKFMSFDPAKMARDFRIPGFDMEQILASQRKNVEALTTANRLAAEGFQALARRQSEIVREGMEELVAALKDVMSAGTPEAGAGKQAALAKQVFEKAIANARELAELVAKSNTEALDVINQRVAESLEELKALTSKA